MRKLYSTLHTVRNDFFKPFGQRSHKEPYHCVVFGPFMCAERHHNITRIHFTVLIGHDLHKYDVIISEAYKILDLEVDAFVQWRGHEVWSCCRILLKPADVEVWRSGFADELPVFSNVRPLLSSRSQISCIVILVCCKMTRHFTAHVEFTKVAFWLNQSDTHKLTQTHTQRLRKLVLSGGVYCHSPEGDLTVINWSLFVASSASSSKSTSDGSVCVCVYDLR